ncbi:hypothetical protein GCM10022227_22710 [Streptomyces sedi]
MRVGRAVGHGTEGARGDGRDGRAGRGVRGHDDVSGGTRRVEVAAERAARGNGRRRSRRLLPHSLTHEKLPGAALAMDPAVHGPVITRGTPPRRRVAGQRAGAH